MQMAKYRETPPERQIHTKPMVFKDFCLALDREAHLKDDCWCPGAPQNALPALPEYQ